MLSIRRESMAHGVKVPTNCSGVEDRAVRADSFVRSVSEWLLGLDCHNATDTDSEAAAHRCLERSKAGYLKLIRQFRDSLHHRPRAARVDRSASASAFSKNAFQWRGHKAVFSGAAINRAQLKWKTVSAEILESATGSCPGIRCSEENSGLNVGLLEFFAQHQYRCGPDASCYYNRALLIARNWPTIAKWQ